MAVFKLAFAFVSLCAVSDTQRPFYAGLRPIGYPETEVVTVGLDNNAYLPIEAKGHRNLVNQINQLPEHKRPFWYLNAGHYDELRKNPQTYQLRPNGYVDRNTARK